ncbi:SMP-30/gluconolactonase/LRE family protein [Nakamurella endophytica]|uniref:SMP-30/Gluconolactonase/LRE-like region domain-containing protein n=1 Tax=Nakamurella endophytica TaxID=1748367 RepID=A0A917SR36_9ACTN|nr:SMP-30/gluconolactonase/LRE family protein [Nakamurella endophytica]GGL94703.1 hypothetical protein GCM10011594_13150 [Nakamurella endophytica]
MQPAFRILATRIGFPEGPVWLPDGRLLVTSMSRGLVYSIDPAAADPSTAVLGQVETGGGPNGLAADGAGRVYVAQNENATMQSPSPRPVQAGLQIIDGDEVTDVPLPDSHAPNDLVVGPDGALWFTDPGTSRRPSAFPPRVRRWEPETGRVTTVSDDLLFPNGLAFPADGSALFVADSRRHEIVRFRRDGDRLVDRSVFARVDGAGPDGVAFDRDGRLYIAAFESDDVVVLDTDGTVADRLSTGERSRPTNVCFAGDGLTTLVVTLAVGGRVVAMDGFSGLPV